MTIISRTSDVPTHLSGDAAGGGGIPSRRHDTTTAVTRRVFEGADLMGHILGYTEDFSISPQKYAEISKSASIISREVIGDRLEEYRRSPIISPYIPTDQDSASDLKILCGTLIRIKETTGAKFTPEIIPSVMDLEDKIESKDIESIKFFKRVLPQIRRQAISLFGTRLPEMDDRNPPHILAAEIRSWFEANQAILNEVAVLHLDNLKLYEVPKEIRFFKNLIVLHLSDNQISLINSKDFDEALRRVDNETTNPWRDNILEDISEALAQAGEITKALSVNARILDSSKYKSSLMSIFKYLKTPEDIDNAIEVLQTMRSDGYIDETAYLFEEALKSIFQAIKINKGCYKRAVTVAMAVANKRSDEYFRAYMLRAISRVLAAAGWGETATKVAMLISYKRIREDAIYFIERIISNNQRSVPKKSVPASTVSRFFDFVSDRNNQVIVGSALVGVISAGVALYNYMWGDGSEG